MLRPWTTIHAPAGFGLSSKASGAASRYIRRCWSLCTELTGEHLHLCVFNGEPVSPVSVLRVYQRHIVIMTAVSFSVDGDCSVPVPHAVSAPQSVHDFPVHVACNYRSCMVQEQIQGNQRIIAPKAVPYPGYRADLLAVIGNLAHGHTASQNAIAATGLELVLAQSHFSVTEPVAREWALWAVRNLCEGNAESQERVRNLKVKTIVQDEVLEMRSQQVEIDQLTGKLKLVDLVG